MFTHFRCRRILIGALAGAALMALSVSVASSQVRQIDVRELPRSTPQNAEFASLAAGTTYQASLVSPTPRLTPDGPRLARHPIRDAATPKGGLRDGWAPLAGSLGPWDPHPLRSRNNVSPRRRRSPALNDRTGTSLRTTRPARWNDGPSPAGRPSTSTRPLPRPASGRSSAGTRPRSESCTIARFAWRPLAFAGRRVVIVIAAPAAGFPQFLPIAKRLLASLRFPPS